MGIPGVDIDKINHDDDNNFSRQTFAWRNKFGNRKELKKDMSKELMPAEWHPTRWWD